MWSIVLLLVVHRFQVKDRRLLSPPVLFSKLRYEECIENARRVTWRAKPLQRKLRGSRGGFPAPPLFF